MLLVDDFGPQRRAWANELADRAVFEAATRKQALLHGDDGSRDRRSVSRLARNGIDVAKDIKAQTEPGTLQRKLRKRGRIID